MKEANDGRPVDVHVEALTHERRQVLSGCIRDLLNEPSKLTFHLPQRGRVAAPLASCLQRAPLPPRTQCPVHRRATDAEGFGDLVVRQPLGLELSGNRLDEQAVARLKVRLPNLRVEDSQQHQPSRVHEER